MACGCPPPVPRGDPRQPARPACCAPAAPAVAALSPRFAAMPDHALERVRQAKAEGRPVVGILCEFAPRELILAAGGVPVCLCGGSHAMVAPAEAELPANLCPLIKSTYGYHLTRTNPFLELCDLVVAETTCDGKKKMYELMAESRPLHVMHLPQRVDAAARELWRGEVRRLHALLQERFMRPVGDGELRAAVRLMEEERRLRRELALLMAAARPPLPGRFQLDLRSLAAGDPADHDEYRRLLATLPAQPGRDGVRVLLTGVPVPHGAEKVVDLIEGHGGTIVAHEHCSGWKPLAVQIDPDAEDIVAAIADAYLHLPCSVMTPNDARLDLIRELSGRFRPQCVVELVWQACLTYDVESARVKRLCGELGLPYLRIGTDYAPGDTARIAVRLEALFEQVRAAA